MPVLMGLLGVWYNDFFGAQTRAVLPYSQRLGRFPAYLQQLTMESNGKSVKADGTPVTTDTGEIWWGEPGTNGQHAFYQLLHQGTRLVPADFIGFAEPIVDADGTCTTSSWRTCSRRPRCWPSARPPRRSPPRARPAAVVPHKVMPGNRPTSTILAPQLTPAVLGQLVALYEHSVFVAGRDLGHQLLRPVGRGARQGDGREPGPRPDCRRAHRPRPGLLDRRPDPPLPPPEGPLFLKRKPVSNDSVGFVRSGRAPGPW